LLDVHLEDEDVGFKCFFLFTLSAFILTLPLRNLVQKSATYIISQMLAIANRRLPNDRHVHLSVDQRGQNFRVVDDAEHGEAVVARDDLEVEDGGVADDCVDSFDRDGEGEGYVALGGGLVSRCILGGLEKGVLSWNGMGKGLPSRWS